MNRVNCRNAFEPQKEWSPSTGWAVVILIAVFALAEFMRAGINAL